MFFVCDKRKINSYLISIGTVLMLLSTAMFIGDTKNDTILTSTASTDNYPIYKIDTKEEKVSISINCNKSAENIDSILKSLDKMKTKATFYITGEFAERYPDEVKKIIKSGNEVGSLGYHYENLKKKSKEEIEEEIFKGKNSIEKVINKKIKTFRAPYGECNTLIIEEAKKQNLTTIQWNLDSLDYNGLDSAEICERIDEGLIPGSIVLLHNDGKNTASSIEDIITIIKKRNYNICTVSELIKLQK